MVNHITVNGVERKVTNTLSCGPGCEPHTYELTNGAYVYRIADVWWLQERGQFKRKVEVVGSQPPAPRYGYDSRTPEPVAAAEPMTLTDRHNAEAIWRQRFQHWPHRFSGGRSLCADCGEPEMHRYHPEVL